MKKRNLKSLKLNKKSISNFDNNGLVGGTNVTNIFVCPSAIVKPICFIRESDPRICTLPPN
ncbi:hypothetical protein [uncultured Kordia sp.]|uniref:hypothetical protein n=1 Tax=uncultured Kordia sp. TaxID=507699 RepID=UPI002639AC9F|nr:hypothetical protein [uncultured Kordia sp.]